VKVSAGSAEAANGLNAKPKDVYFEEILERCCGTGRWQILLVGYLSYMWLIFPTYSMSMMFVGATPKYKCADGFPANATYDELPDDTPRCHPLNSNATDACQRWVYDQSVYLSTAVTEWNLVCSRRVMLSLLQSLLHAGGIVGSIVGGQLSDRIGRRKPFIGGMFLVVICSFTVALTSSYEVFVSARFFTGIAMGVMVGTQYVSIMELCGTKERAAFGTVSFIPFSLGIVLISAESYAIRTRWLLQLAFAVPSLLFLPYIWFMPESPRWLVLNCKFTEAYELLRTGARLNKREMPPEQEVHKLMTEARESLLARQAERKMAAGGGLLQQLLQLVRTPRMRRYTLACCFIQFVIAGSYFGIAFDMTQLSSSPHLAGVLIGITEIPSTLCFPMLNRLGRRTSLLLCLFTAALAMLLIFVKEDSTLWLVLGLISKLGVSTAWNAITVQCAELMPTQARGLAFGVNQMWTRIGATLSPFVVDLVSDLHKTAPSGVFGGMVLLAGLTGFLLPETVNQPMPECVADVEVRNWEQANDRGASNNGFQADDKM